MPPPTASDPWLSSRRFGIVIDAGSSGSRLQIYSWKDARVEQAERAARGDPLDVLPRVEKGTRTSDDWLAKIEPGISQYALEPSLVGPYLAPLLSHAQAHIPPSLHASTPIYLLATAGMRLLPSDLRTQLIEEACNFLRFHSDFHVDEAGATPDEPCGSSIRVITGEEEGLFGWIAVNYLLDGFAGSARERATYGFLDMGGASTQIAFEPSEAYRLNPAVDLMDVRLRMLDGSEARHDIFVTTWLGYGTNQARERYIASLIARWDEAHGPGEDDVVLDPCLPLDLQLSEVPLPAGLPASASPHSHKPHTLRGTGSFTQCLDLVEPLLNKTAPCPDTTCLFNGVHVPPIDFSSSRFIGVSEYWYSSEHVFGLGGAYDFVEYERAAVGFCGRGWEDITQEHFAALNPSSASSSSSMERAEQTPSDSPSPDSLNAQHPAALHPRNTQIDMARLQLQCFKAAWIVNVLHEGIGLPRLVDPGGNSTSLPSSSDTVADNAGRKGLGQPAFQSMDTVGDTAITWTLGKMVLEASRDIPRGPPPPPPPIHHPDVGEGPTNTYDEDWLPSGLDDVGEHLSRRPGWAYVGVACLILFLLYAYRARLRPLWRRLGLMRPGGGRMGNGYAQAYAMESGLGNGNGDGSTERLDSPPPLSPMLGAGVAGRNKGLPAFVGFALRRLRGALSPAQPRPPSRSSMVASGGGGQDGSSGATANAYFLPQTSSSSSVLLRTASPALDPSSLAVPAPGSPTRGSGPGGPGGLGGLKSLSRNSSQVNLTTLVTRSSSYVRGGGPW